AEDGIRDFHVTGVQTCALPISMVYLVLLPLAQGQLSYFGLTTLPLAVRHCCLNRPTAVDTCGVNPTNQASLLSLLVPVLPATGRPGSAALRPVPDLTTASSATTASAAASGEMTWL